MSLYVFNKQQEVIKIIPYRRIVALTQEQELNSTDELILEIPNEDWLTMEEEPSYMAVKDVYSRYSYHLYKVIQDKTGTHTSEIRGIQVGFDELKAYGYIKDRRFSSYSVRRVAEVIVEGTDWELGYVSDSLPTVSTNFYYISRLESLSKLIELTGAEVQFRVEINGNKISAKRMDLYEKLGKDTGKRFAYGDRLLSVTKETDNVGVVTALVGRGRGEETETGGFGRKITFEDVEWGEDMPVVKPKGQEYVEIPEMTALYGYKDGTPRYGIAEFNDTEDPEELLEQTYRALVDMSRPQVQFKASVQVVGDLGLGDTVAIIRKDVGIQYKTRVYKVVRDLLNNNRTVVELGDKVGQSVGKTLGKIVSTVKEQREEMVNIVQTAANGKNRIYRGEQEPTSGMMVGDLWYKPVSDGEVEMYQWNGTIWELVITSGVNEELEQRLDQAHKDIDYARGEAQKALDEVGTAFEDISGLTVTVGHLSNKWIMAIEDGDDIVTAINATRDGVYVKGNKIILDGDTTIAGSFTVTDTIFANNMSISKFTTGTLNASDVNIINLNADNISTGTLNAQLITTGFNNAVGGGVEITRDGIKSVSNDSLRDYTILERGGIRFYTANGNAVGSIETGYSLGNNRLNSVGVFLEAGRRFTVGRKTTGGLESYLLFTINERDDFVVNPPAFFSEGLEVGGGVTAITYNVGIKGSYIAGNTVGGMNIVLQGNTTFDGKGVVMFKRPVDVYNNLNMQGRTINNAWLDAHQLKIQEGVVASSASGGYMMLTANKKMQVTANDNIEMFSRGTSAMLIGRDNVLMWRNINMQGYNITNQSDIRLKEDIRPTRVSGIRETKRLRMVDYKWKKDHPVTKGYTQEEQFGIIAQDSQFLQTRDEGRDSYLSVNMNKQINLNTLTNQELITKVERLEAQIKTIMEAV